MSSSDTSKDNASGDPVADADGEDEGSNTSGGDDTGVKEDQKPTTK